MESAIAIVFVICIFLTFYFTFLSFQAIDDSLKKQLLNFAVLFLITGGILLASFAIYLGIKQAFSNVSDELERSKEALEHGED